MKETVNSDSGIVITIIGRNRILILLPVNNYNLNLFKKNCNEVLNQMKDNVMRFLGESISFGVSDICKDILKLSHYYEQAVESLIKKRFQGKTNFVAESNNELTSTKILTLDISDEKALLDSLRGKGEYSPDKVINRIFDRFKNYNNEDMQLVLAELLNILIREIQANNLSSDKIFQESELNYNKVISSMNIPELKDWFADKFCKLYMSLLRIRTYKRFNENTKKAICYIEKNYYRNISLNDIAEAINVNSSYLSRIFKNDTGENIIEYLNKIRMEKAALLINEGKYTLKEISYKVGIQNYNYFFRLYKKFIGVRPSEYRKNEG